MSQQTNPSSLGPPEAGLLLQCLNKAVGYSVLGWVAGPLRDALDEEEGVGDDVSADGFDKASERM
jgi:hypothetical protein